VWGFVKQPGKRKKVLKGGGEKWGGNGVNSKGEEKRGTWNSGRRDAWSTGKRFGRELHRRGKGGGIRTNTGHKAVKAGL